MNFMTLLQSLDDLLYEVMSWAVFFPITLWRTITGPLGMMEYAHNELRDRPESQYQDTLSPPLFLLLALLLSHSIELALGTTVNPIVARTSGLAAYVDSDGKLLMLRLMFFSIIPLMLAVALLAGLRQKVTRERLRAPFYAQCYPAGAFALAIGIGGLLLSETSGTPQLAGGLLMPVALVAYFVVQAAWFRRHLRCGLLASTAYAGASISCGIGLVVLLALLFV